MAKKVVMSAKKKPRVQTSEDWVSAGREEAVEKKKAAEKLRRLTLDLPEDLHRAIKHKSVEEGTTMVALLRSLLSKHFGV